MLLPSKDRYSLVRNSHVSPLHLQVCCEPHDEGRKTNVRFVLQDFPEYPQRLPPRLEQQRYTASARHSRASAAQTLSSSQPPTALAEQAASTGIQSCRTEQLSEEDRTRLDILGHLRQSRRRDKKRWLHVGIPWSVPQTRAQPGTTSELKRR